MSELLQRILSASIMMPVAITVIWIGSWYFAALVSLISVFLLFEWLRICEYKSKGGKLIILLTIATVPILIMLNQEYLSIIFLVAGTFLSLVTNKDFGIKTRLLRAAGIPYIGITCITLIWLRNDYQMGVATIYWLVLIIVATDTAGYIVGRLMGGPKLVVKISPNKTWAGFVGGVVTAGGVGLIAAKFSEQPNLIILIIMSASLGVVAQMGDLFASALKRKFSVKNSSNLIPGHGGVLDRFDGFLAATPILALLTWLLEGSPLTWS